MNSSQLPISTNMTEKNATEPQVPQPSMEDTINLDQIVPFVRLESDLISFRFFKKLVFPHVILLIQPTDVHKSKIPSSLHESGNMMTESTIPEKTSITGVPSYHTDGICWLHLWSYWPPTTTLHLGGNVSESSPRVRMSFHPRISRIVIHLDLLSGSTTSNTRFSINSCCMDRTYPFVLPNGRKLAWKGTRKDAAASSETSRFGHLKLVEINESAEDQGRVLALYENMSDLHALGTMTIMTKVENLMPELGEDMMAMVLASCVAVVLLERTQSKGCFGGMGKGLKENDRRANSL